MIHWRKKMIIDGGVIDRDHQHLIEIINRFAVFAADGLTIEEGLEILYSLKFYAATHFKREEGIHLRAHYPHYDAHKREHRELLAELDGIIAKLGDHNADDADKPLDEIAAETTHLLQHWLMDHVLHSDLQLKPFVEALRKAGEHLEDLADVEA